MSFEAILLSDSSIYDFFSLSLSGAVLTLPSIPKALKFPSDVPGCGFIFIHHAEQSHSWSSVPGHSFGFLNGFPPIFSVLFFFPEKYVFRFSEPVLPFFIFFPCIFYPLFFFFSILLCFLKDFINLIF